MTFTPKQWADGESGHTPIVAADLNRMEQGIADGQNAAAVAAGTRAQLDTGTDTTQRTWAAKDLAEYVAAAIAAAAAPDTRSAPRKRTS